MSHLWLFSWKFFFFYITIIHQIKYQLHQLLDFLPTDALSHDWVSVPKSQFGEQLWDKNSVQKNQDGSIRVFSKFLPKSTTEITTDILYTMDVDCSKNSFRDVAVGAKEFDEFKNKDSGWKDPNGDKLILGVIDQVCTFRKSVDAA